MRTALYIGVAIGVYFWLKHTFGNWSENLNDKKNTPLAFVAIILLAVL